MTPDAELSGYAEVRGAWQVGVEGTPWNLTEKVRPRFEISPTERITVETVILASFTQGRVAGDEAAAVIAASDVGALLEQADCAYSPEPRYDAASDYLSVERLHVDFNLPFADITVGRQAVNWGSALVFHPTDLYSEVVATDPGSERRGVNALKVNVPVGDHSVVALVALDDDLSPLTQDEPEVPVSAAAKLTVNALGTDVSGVGHYGYGGDWFAGGDVRGTNLLGWWVEGGWHGGVDEPGLEVVVGADYSFPVLDQIYVAAEYRYDQTGDPPLGDPVDGVEPGFYDLSERAGGVASPYTCSFLPARTPGTRTTLGIHYVDATVRVAFTEDIGVSGLVLVNLLDSTGLVVPDAYVNIGANATAHVGAQIFFGEHGEFRPASEDLTFAAGTASADLSVLFPDATVLAWVRTSF